MAALVALTGGICFFIAIIATVIVKG